MNKTNIVKYDTSRLPVQFTSIGILLLIVSVVLFFNDKIILPSILFVLSFVLLNSKEGVKINAQELKLQHYSRFLGFYIGSWELIKLPEYITIVRVNIKQDINFVALERTTSVSKCKVALINKDNSITSICNLKYHKAKELSFLLSNALNIKILDVVSGKKVWLN